MEKKPEKLIKETQEEYTNAPFTNPEYHKHDGIDQPRLFPKDFHGFPIYSVTPTNSAEEGTPVFQSDGTDVLMWVMLNKTWNLIGQLPVYGEMGQHNLSTVVTISSSNTWYIIPAMSAGINKNVTFQSGQELLVTLPGVYRIYYNLSFEDGGNNTFEVSLAVNNVIETKSSCFQTTSNANDLSTVSGTATINLIDGDVVTLQINNNNNTSNPTIEHAEVVINRIDY